MIELEQAYDILYTATLICLGIVIIAALVRSVSGKRIVDRFIGINMITTVTVMAISLLAILLGEIYLADVALIYVVLSALALLILCKIYINIYAGRGGKKHDR